MLSRISVVGTSGAGKTTLARRIAQQLQIPHIELDALHWEPHWTPAELPVFRERVQQALQCDRWVVDGNYSAVRPLVWGRADTVVWLDYPFSVVMRRIIWRTLKRGLLQEVLWSGNRESLRQGLLSRESMILWSFQTYGERRKQYPLLFQQPEYSHLRLIQLHSPTAAQNWLRSLG